MKLHLPTSLFRSVLAAMSVAAALTCTVEAGTLHQDVSQQTYTDFAQNKGRYAVGGHVNALLQHLNKDGVQITYTGGQDPITLETPMMDFGCLQNGGCGAAMGYNWMVTAGHNNLSATRNATFSRFSLPEGSSIHYYGIECGDKNESVFRHISPTDLKLVRMNKLITDATGTTPWGATDGNFDSQADLKGQLLVRAGGGTMYRLEEDGSATWLYSPYGYTTGAVDTIDHVTYDSSSGNLTIIVTTDRSSEGISPASPLPYDAEAGDSGSPAWVWNAATEQYEYVTAHHGSAGMNVHSKGNNEWIVETLVSHDVNVEVTSSMISLNAITTPGESYTSNTNPTGMYGTVYSGTVTANGEVLATYNGIEKGKQLWKDLSALKDTQNWYAYDNTYMNATETVTAGSPLSYADLYHNSNLVLTANTASVYVMVEDEVDLGIGYVQFKLGEVTDKLGQPASAAEFTIVADASGAMLNSAGFIVEKGVTVRMEMTNPANYMREWRKTGEGTLVIADSYADCGNNDIFLNVGGNGLTSLERGNGYAAYNVLANNGSTVRIKDIGQIARDFTFGNGGGVLDMNGNSMTWNNDNTAAAEGFTIHALDEQAVISNSQGSTTLTWTQGGNREWLGSFIDTQSGALKFVYNGGTNAHLTMNGIHTDLTHNSGSGIEVKSGTLALQGTNTIHAIGSTTGTTLDRYFQEDDWHYADAAANITVSGGTFELGHHARLTGDITVESGATFVMREGVAHQMEYIEGGYTKENTDAIRDFFGLKGDVKLNNGSQMKVEFNEGADSTLVYGGNISGAGSLSADTGLDANLNGGTLYLTGDNSGHTGQKTLHTGALYATTDAALGDTSTNKWVVEEKAWLASDSFTTADTIREHIDASSCGVVALTQNITDAVALEGGHEGLIVGAVAGEDIHYGTMDASLAAVNGKWTLGGGGGNLIVDFRLEGENDLVLGNAWGKGNVHLSNTANTLSGSIVFAGWVTLTHEAGALGTAGIDLQYMGRLRMTGTDQLKYVETSATGVLLMDLVGTENIDLSEHQDVVLGAQGESTYSGQIKLADGAAYRFGGNEGTFTVASTLEAGHDVVIDGETYRGGTVVLADSSAVNGQVRVMGQDASRSNGATGTATLSFVADDSLAQAASVSVEDGGAIELAGTNQRFNNVSISALGAIHDSSAERSSTLTLNNTTETSVEGSLNVASIIKTGDGELNLGGENTYSSLEVQGGKVTVTAEAATSAGADVIIGSGAILDQGGYKANGNLTLQSGSKVENVSNISGNVQVQGDSVFRYRQVASQVNESVNGKMTVEDGATLSMNLGEYRLLTLNGLSGDGDIDATSQTMHVLALKVCGDNADFRGHLTVHGQGTYPGTNTMTGLTLDTAASAGVGTITLDNAQLRLSNKNDASSALKATLDIASGGAYLNSDNGRDYYFSGLSGVGQLSVGSGSAYSAIFLGDVRNFSGVVKVASTGSAVIFGGTGINYHEVTGTAGTDAINLFAPNATLKGVQSGSTMTSTFSFCYEDDVVLNARVVDSHVTQSGTGTLVLGVANAGYYGELTISEGSRVQLGENGSWAGRLKGSGTLVNMNTTEEGAAFYRADEFSGSLELVQGSKLKLQDGTSQMSNYTLGSGESLTILEGPAGGSATLHVKSLVLSGGGLFFDAGALVDGGSTASLSLTNGSVTAGSELTQCITFLDTTQLAVGTYLLASGDWSALDENRVELSGIDDYFSSELVTDSNGLHLTLSLAEGAHVWAGADGKNQWNSSCFGTTTDTPGSTAPVYFTDAAAQRTVDVTENVTVGKLVFNITQKDYELGGEGHLSASALELKGGGAVALGPNVSLSGASTVAAASELRVSSFETFGAGTSVSGEGTLSVDAGEASGRLLANLTGLNTLRLLSGRYEAGTSAINAATIEVVGGQYYISGGTHGNAFVLGGSGWSKADGDYASAALRTEEGTTLSGSITLASDATMAVTRTGTVAGSTGLTGSLNTGDYTLFKTGNGALWLQSANVFGNIDVCEGMLVVDKEKNVAKLGELTLRDGTSLKVGWGCGLVAEAIHMKGQSKIELRNGGGSYNVLESAIDIDGTATILGSYSGNKTQVKGSITGNGTLNLSTDGTNKDQWKISASISDGAGENERLAVETNSNVTLSGKNTYTGGTTVNGKMLTTENEAALGGGALTVNSSGTLSQNADLRVSTLGGDGTVSMNAYTLTLGNGTTASDSATFAGALSNGKLIMTGEGTQELTGSVDLAKATVSGGTLAITGTTATVSEGVEVAAGGTLALKDAAVAGAVSLLEGGTASLAGNISLSQTISSAGTVNIGEGVNLQLSTSFDGYDEALNTYTIISGGHINYAESGLSFTVDKYSSEDLGADNYTIECSTNQLSITVDLSNIGQEITWNGGGDKDTWSSISQHENWQKGDNRASEFSSLSKVTFGEEGSHSVEVDDLGVKVDSMTIADAGYTFSGGSIRSLGDVTLTEAGATTIDADLTVKGKLSLVAGTTLQLGGNNDIAELSLSRTGSADKLEFAAGTTTTIGENQGEDAWRWMGDGNNKKEVTISVGEGATVTDQSYWRMYGSTLTVEGGGVYKVEGFCLSDGNPGSGSNKDASTLTIDTGTTMEVTGTETGAVSDLAEK